MILCITEKPSVARDIASILGATSDRRGFFEGNGYCVTWLYGHLCTLKEPADYTESWKKWSLGVLPMIPPKFGIKVMDDANKQRQLDLIRTLASKASKVINCGDAGQEGELIQRWVMQLADVKCPVERLWISSMTDDSIREGFSHLRPEADFNNLYHAGLSRAIGDWILGMNATRLYTLKYSVPGSVLSIGRVQTPTLALIVQRHFEIVNFKPEDYWELKTLYRDTTFNATSGRFSTEQDAAKALEEIVGKPLTISGVTEKEGRESPPRLFDLTSLQVECNRKWGWSAEETLRLIQILYEKKVTTYPRVDTTYLSDDIYPKVPDILRSMTPYAALTAPVLGAKIPKSKKIFDNSKITDHHAIIPTGQSPMVLVGEERKLYHLIALRFIAAFYPDCRFMQTTVDATVDQVPFRATGKVITSPGWRDVYGGNADAQPAEDSLLPAFVKGESGPHEPSLLKKTTQPPKYYTEGTLLRAMESAGKTVDDETLREALKENGIGRPSTRAAIIETLFKRRYIVRNRKSIDATQAGIDLIATIKDELLKSAALTGIWENKLRRIERGDYSAARFISELKKQISEIVINVLSDNTGSRIIVNNEETKEKSKDKSKDKKSNNSNPSNNSNSSNNSNNPNPPQKKPRTTRLDQIPCPACGQGHLLKGRTAYGCSRFREGCGMLLDFNEYPADLTPGKLKKLISSRYKKQ